MDFELSEEHQFAYESALGFGQNEIRPRIAEMERDDAFPAGLWHKLGEQGQTGLSTAFDMPTLYGYDTDHSMAAGEFGKCGVAISSLADMEILYQDLPLDKITTSMTINSPFPASHTTSEKACAAQRKLHQQALQHDLSH
jgi:methylmalonyl-CoA mutase N-terminal domain/subunit